MIKRLPVVSQKERILKVVNEGGSIASLSSNGRVYLDDATGARIAQLRWDVPYHTWKLKSERMLDESTGRRYGHKYTKAEPV